MIIGLFDPVNDADVRMVESRRGAGFAQQVVFVDMAEGDIGRKEFQRDGALELQVYGLVYHTHPAGAQPFGDLVVRDGLSQHGWKTNVEILGGPPGQVNEMAGRQAGLKKGCAAVYVDRLTSHGAGLFGTEEERGTCD